MATYAPLTTISDLRDYVTGPGSGFAARAESTVLLHVSHSHLKARFPEIRLDLHVEFCRRGCLGGCAGHPSTAAGARRA